MSGTAPQPDLLSKNGWAPCSKCGTQQPRRTLEEVDGFAGEAPAKVLACRDAAWCAKQVALLAVK